MQAKKEKKKRCTNKRRANCPTTMSLGQSGGRGAAKRQLGWDPSEKTDQKSATLKQNVKYTNNKMEMPSGVHLLNSNE